MRNSEELIARIYEAAALPEIWPQVLDGLSSTVSAMGAAVATRRSDQWAGYVSSLLFQPHFGTYLASPRSLESTATLRVIAEDRAGFISEDEIFSAEEWVHDPLYADWVGPTGGGHGVATAINVPSGEFLVVHLHRKHGAPAFSQKDRNVLDSFRPHLARAGLLAARLRLERLSAAAEALALIGLPALILSPSGSVLAANSLMESYTDHLTWLSKDRVALADSAANAMLARALADLGNPAAATVRSFAARSRFGLIPVVAHLIPTPGQSRDLFDGALGVLIITPVTAPTAPDVAVIRGLFDLSCNEARVARGIAEGLTVNDIAARHGVGRETVRSQVKAVLAKTGAKHQGEVAALLGGIPRFPVAGADIHNPK